MTNRTLSLVVLGAALAATSLAAQAPSCPASMSPPLPRSYAGAVAGKAISPCNLMTRLYQFADDSMRGRQLGTPDNLRAVEWIEAQAKLAGLSPAGEQGTWLQRLPLFIRTLDTTSTLVAATVTLHAGRDFVAGAVGQVSDIGALDVVFGGVANDTANLLTNTTVRGKLVLLLAGPGASPALQRSPAFKAYQASLAGATIATIIGDTLPTAAVRAAFAPTGAAAVRLATQVAANRPSPLNNVIITRRAAAAILGVPLAQATKGMPGVPLTVAIRFVDTPVELGRNVVAVLPGSDSRLRGEYVVLGAHSDGPGMAARPVEHDSIRVVDQYVRPHGTDAPVRALPPNEWPAIRQQIDSLRTLDGGTRADSIFNGADAGGTGAVSLVEIANQLSHGKRPRRSILFIWHTGEERGNWGSQYFAESPTVPRDSLVAYLNVDQLGRAGDQPLQAIGAHRLSKELAAMIADINTRQSFGFAFDSTRDAPGHPANAACRNDHGTYATWNIPSVWFTSGENADVHTITDEPAYVQYRPRSRRFVDRRRRGFDRGPSGPPRARQGGAGNSSGRVQAVALMMQLAPEPLLSQEYSVTFPVVSRHLFRASAFLALFAATAHGQQQCPATAAGALPLKYAGAPTVAAITPCDLMTRLYAFSDDSMQGREVGTEGHLRATAYIERAVRALGLKPAGDSGGYFQNLPVVMRSFDTTSTVTTGGVVWHTSDFLAQTGGAAHQFHDVASVYAGKLLDTTAILPIEQTKGKLLVFLPPDQAVDADAIEATAAFQKWYQMFQSGAGRVIIAGYQLPDGMLKSAAEQGTLSFANSEEPIELVTTVRLAEAILGAPLLNAVKGAPGKSLSSDIRFTDAPRPGRNVVAILPGSDPALRGEYVAIGAHNDHLGIADTAVDHDSLRLYNAYARPQGADGGASKPLTPARWQLLRASIDSLHKLHGGARRDSIYNGADDDGSGSVSVLEIAEAFAKGAAKPKRSILFIWHAGEEKGLWGSEYFTDHPTVPRDSIVAELNMDMVGRGQPSDVTGTTKSGELIHGSANYLQLIGSRRLSTELGDLVEKVNTDARLGFTFDYALDADGHPEDIYCRSDHAEYARYGIPIAFFTTGGHEDYHQVTDEAEYIDYPHMAKVDQLVFDIAMQVADLGHRVVVDHPKPDPHGTCQQ